MDANMNYFIINLTDSAGLDQQIAIGVEEPREGGCAAQCTIDRVLSRRGREIAFPLVVDIHRADDFPKVATLYDGVREQAVGLN